MRSQFYLMMFLVEASLLLVVACSSGAPSEREKSVAVPKSAATPQPIKYDRPNSVPEKTAVPARREALADTAHPQKPDTPSVEDAAAFIKQQRYTNGSVEIRKIVKTDGRADPSTGGYLLEYRLELTCVKEYERQTDPMNPYTDWGECPTVGAIQTGNGSLIFVRMETGWKVVDNPFLNHQNWFNADN